MFGAAQVDLRMWSELAIATAIACSITIEDAGLRPVRGVSLDLRAESGSSLSSLRPVLATERVTFLDPRWPTFRVLTSRGGCGSWKRSDTDDNDEALYVEVLPGDDIRLRMPRFRSIDLPDSIDIMKIIVEGTEDRQFVAEPKDVELGDFVRPRCVYRLEMDVSLDLWLRDSQPSDVFKVHSEAFILNCSDSATTSASNE